MVIFSEVYSLRKDKIDFIKEWAKDKNLKIIKYETDKLIMEFVFIGTSEEIKNWDTYHDRGYINIKYWYNWLSVRKLKGRCYPRRGLKTFIISFHINSKLKKDELLLQHLEIYALRLGLDPEGSINYLSSKELALEFIDDCYLYVIGDWNSINPS